MYRNDIRSTVEVINPKPFYDISLTIPIKFFRFGEREYLEEPKKNLQPRGVVAKSHSIVLEKPSIGGSDPPDPGSNPGGATFSS